MARKKRPKGPAKKQQKTVLKGGFKDPKLKARMQSHGERLKRQQAAKRRPRDSKGRFIDGPKEKTEARRAAAAQWRKLPRAEQERVARSLLAAQGRKKTRGEDLTVPITNARVRKMDARRTGKVYDKRGEPMETARQHRELGTMLLQSNRQLAQRDPESLAMRATINQIASITGGTRLSSRDLQPTPVRTKRIGDQAMSKRELQDVGWRTGRDIYKGSPKPARGRVPTVQFIEQTMSPSHKQWLEAELKDPHSAFNEGVLTTSPLTRGRFASAGQRRRVDTYVDMLQQGLSHEEAMSSLRTERRGGGGGAARRAKSGRTTRNEEIASGVTRGNAMDVIDARYNQAGRTSKSARVEPTKSNFKYSVEMPRVSRVSELEKIFPNLTERDYIIIQQAQREELLERDKGRRWQIEDKMAQTQGAQGKRGPDRVVVFTTSAGSPTVSVPSDSLIGQYIIRRRKRMLKQEGVAKAGELHGRFPDAVRDMHVIESAAGGSLGLVGRAGVYSKSGWRVGTKKSKNFGKPVPIGATLMTDASGRPIYDAQGNVRYTEGGSRRVEFGTQGVGLRVFLG